MFNGRTQDVGMTACFESLATPCRCNNVLYMRGVPEGDEDGEAKAMES